ncbi:MAG: uroporphyrinogen decarboxylase [Firmicutes bacterium]|nr:uroporphyrinogen decarboxylase [Bacillota bacterium]
MNDAKARQQERIENYKAILSGKMPHRVPINISLDLHCIANFGKIDPKEALWGPSILKDAAEKMCQTLFSDNCPYGGTIRFPSFYHILKSQNYQMGKNGFIQHPEVVGMLPEDYDYLIENPYDCLMERVVPRQHKALCQNDPIQSAISLFKAFRARNNALAESAQISRYLTEKYGYTSFRALAPGGNTSAPFDFLADQLRSFSGISMDVRRIPDKVAAACDALYPIMFQKGLPLNYNEFSIVGNMMHMPTFMREKDFAKLFYPTFKQQIEEYASLGIKMFIFCEDDWMRYLDYLVDLPTNTIIMFEYGDPKIIKEKLGKKHILTGLYPISLVKNGTRQQVIDKAKELIDIMAPGGKYMFCMDKSPLSLADINLDNLCALTEFVRDYAVYDNYGEETGLQFNQDDYKMTPSSDFTSKYYQAPKQLKAASPEIPAYGLDKLLELEHMTFIDMMFLLV